MLCVLQPKCPLYNHIHIFTQYPPSVTTPPPSIQCTSTTGFPFSHASKLSLILIQYLNLTASLLAPSKSSSLNALSNPPSASSILLSFRSLTSFKSSSCCASSISSLVSSTSISNSASSNFPVSSPATSIPRRDKRCCARSRGERRVLYASFISAEVASARVLDEEEVCRSGCAVAWRWRNSLRRVRGLILKGLAGGGPAGKVLGKRS
ncbi:hypothetical protein ACMFMG_012172 [Clarireedia jacksonii]